MDKRNTPDRLSIIEIIKYVKYVTGSKANAADLSTVATTGSYNDLSDKPTIPSLTGYATEAWVEVKGYQTASDVQTAIDGIPDELPTVTASDNGKFLRVVSGAWAAQTVPSAESNSFGGGS